MLGTALGKAEAASWKRRAGCGRSVSAGSENAVVGDLFINLHKIRFFHAESSFAQVSICDARRVGGLCTPRKGRKWMRHPGWGEERGSVLGGRGDRCMLRAVLRSTTGND